MIVGDDPTERVSIIVNSVTEKIYPVAPKPEGQPIIRKAFDTIFDQPISKTIKESGKDHKTIYITGLCEVSGYSVGLMASHKK